MEVKSPGRGFGGFFKGNEKYDQGKACEAVRAGKTQ
jgi:hypothetical protein